MTLKRFVTALVVALTFVVPAASAVTLTSSYPFIGDSVPVTLTMNDVSGGNAVEITVSIPEGQGDILGLFDNVTNEALVPAMGTVSPDGLVTQQQYAANQVWKVGGGNDMDPVRNWDWGLRFESLNWQSEDIHTVTFRLTAPGLTVAHLVNAANQGWYFGVRVQHTLGPKTKGNIGFGVSSPPSGTAPTLAIAAPLYFRDVYERSGAALPAEAAAMGQLDVDLLREGRAIALIHREDQGPTGPVDRQYPVQLVRSADGRWLVLDY